RLLISKATNPLKTNFIDIEAQTITAAMFDRIGGSLYRHRLFDRFVEALDRPGAQVMRRPHISSSLQMFRHRHDLLITQKLEGGSIKTSAFIVSPKPQMSQEMKPFRRKLSPTGDPP